MGAVDFDVYRKGTDMGTAYREAVEDAAHEYGHGGYTGTIAETNGVRQVVYAAMTGKGAEWRSGLDRDEAEKWGPALAIPVAADSEFTFKKVRLPVELPPSFSLRDWDGEPTATAETTEYDLRDHAVKAAFEKYGELVHDIKVVPSLKTKLVAEAVKGRSETRYRVGTTLYHNKAQAIAAAKKALTSGYTPYPMKIEAVRYWPDADTTVCATVRKVTVSASAKVTVTLATPKKARPPVTGWLFYGIASS